MIRPDISTFTLFILRVHSIKVYPSCLLFHGRAHVLLKKRECVLWTRAYQTNMIQSFFIASTTLPFFLKKNNKVHMYTRVIHIRMFSIFKYSARVERVRKSYDINSILTTETVKTFNLVYFFDAEHIFSNSVSFRSVRWVRVLYK